MITLRKVTSLASGVDFDSMKLDLNRLFKSFLKANFVESKFNYASRKWYEVKKRILRFNHRMKLAGRDLPLKADYKSFVIALHCDNMTFVRPHMVFPLLGGGWRINFSSRKREVYSKGAGA